MPGTGFHALRAKAVLESCNFREGHPIRGAFHPSVGVGFELAFLQQGADFLHIQWAKFFAFMVYVDFHYASG